MTTSVSTIPEHIGITMTYQANNSDETSSPAEGKIMKSI